MMRKFFALVPFVFCLASCDMFSSASESTTYTPNEVGIQIIDGEQTYNKTVLLNRLTDIDEYTKEGYGLEGIYDSPEGGTKYFSSDGKMLRNYVEGDPTVFYTHWQSIEGLTNTGTYEGPDELSYYQGYNFTPKASTTFGNAMKGNRSKNVKASISFYATETSSSEDWVYYISYDDSFIYGNKTANKIVDITGGKIIYPSASPSQYSISKIMSSADVSVLQAKLWISRGLTTGKGKIYTFLMNGALLANEHGK